MTEGRFTAFTGMGSALPERVVPNSLFERTLDTSDAWIRDRTGIGARRFVADGENTSDLVVRAARIAMGAARIAPEQIDVLVVGTFTPDRPMPSTAVIAQAKLGMSCPAFDVNAACAGFSYGVSVGSGLIASGTAEHVLVVGADVLSRKLNLSDRSTAVLFGDGAGAAVLSVADEPGIMASSLAADGTQADVLTVPAGGVDRPVTPEAVERGEDKIVMTSGREVFRRAVLAMTNACRELLDKAGVRPDDLALVIPHQANARIISAVAERLGVGPERAVLDIEEVGNTSAASIPIALDRAWRAGRLAPGDLVLMVSFGAGLAWGAHLLRWTADASEAA